MPVDTEAELQSRTLRRAQRQATQLQADQELIDAGSGQYYGPRIFFSHHSPETVSFHFVGCH